MLNRPRIYVYRFTAIYFIFSIIWIKFSDGILFKYLKISNDTTSFQTYKEVFFIFFSTALLYFVQLSEIIKSESKDKIEPDESFDGVYNLKLKKSDENKNNTISVNHEIFKNMRHGLILTDRNCKIAEISETANKILGYGKNGTDLIGLDMSSLFSANQFKEISENFMNGNNHYEKEIFLKRRDKCFLPAWISISLVKGHSDEFDHYVLVMEDLTEFKAKEQKIRNLKKLDPLTGLKNQDAMNKYLKKLPTHKFNFAVLYIDINNLKLINDSLGRNTGDEVLKKSGERLLEIEDKYIKLYRMRGDEFILLVMGEDNVRPPCPAGSRSAGFCRRPWRHRGWSGTVAPAMTTRGFNQDDSRELANWMCDIVDSMEGSSADDAVVTRVREQVGAVCARLPVYG